MKNIPMTERLHSDRMLNSFFVKLCVSDSYTAAMRGL